MRAVRQDVHGTPDVLHEVVLPTPSPGPGEVLVAVHAAGVNPTDWWNRAQVATVDRLPLVLGWDVSGVVAAVGVGVTLFRPGDEVFGMLPYPDGVGSHAEYVTAPAHTFALKPARIDHVQAGALPLAALTAYQALVETADVRAGQRVLIHAAAGGVGHLAVQIASSRGAYVIGTASAAKHDFLRSLGVDEPVDYRTVDVAQAVKDVDVVLDPVSRDPAGRARSLAVLRPSGTLVSILPVPVEPDELAAIAARGIRFESLLVQSDHAGMQAVADLVEAGGLRAHIEATFPLAEAAEAHALGETGRTTGKIVLVVRDEPGAAELTRRLRRDVFARGDTAVVDRLVRTDYIQHNPLAPDGPDAMKSFGATMRQQFPDATYSTLRVVTDDDLVLLHSHDVLVPGTPGMAVFDLFRFEEGKIAEHWDVYQEVPASTANGNDMFSTLSEPRTTGPRQRWFTEDNRRLVSAFVDDVMVGRDLSAVDTYVAADHHQHDPSIPDGSEGLRAALAAYFEQFPDATLTPKRVIAEGDLVAVHSHLVPVPGERGHATFDLYRVRGRKLVEHWSATQQVPESAANDNTMF